MQRFEVHPVNPQMRQVDRVAEAVARGELVIFPTDTTYALACGLRARKALAALYALKGVPKEHPMSLLCADLAQASTFAVLENAHHRVLRQRLPGPFTFILPATREAAKLLLHKQKTVGIRIADDLVAQALLSRVGEPLLATSVTLRYESEGPPLDDPDEIAEAFDKHVAVMLSRGRLSNIPSTVIDLTTAPPSILRQGAGAVSWLAP